MMKTTAQLQTDQSPHRSTAESNRPLREPKGSAILDNRPEAVAQRRLAEAIHNSPSMVAQRRQLRSLFGETAQLKGGPEEEELLQKKVAPVQRRGPEDEDLLQGKFDVRQRKGLEEEEPLQGKIEGMSSAQLKEEASKPNNTGLPDNLKSDIESLSGLSMDDVIVHYNSSQPARLNALAYTQGTDIHLAPGQEQHLPHEAWHVVQQAQGRVQPTMQLKDGVPVNDDRGLEQEADVMGAKALQMPSLAPGATGLRHQGASSLQRVSETQGKAEGQGKGIGASGEKVSLNFLSPINRAGCAQLHDVQAAPAHSGVVQRTPLRVISTWITHLVHEHEGSIFEGFEVNYGEVSPSDKLVIDDDDIIISRRGPNQEIQENRERDRLGPQIHDWFRVIVVNGKDVRDKKLYLRDKTFVTDNSPYVSGTLEDLTAATTLEKFRHAIELFQGNEEMSFSEFCSMLRKARFEGSIHAEDPQNNPIIEYSQPRKNLITQLEYARSLALKPLFGDEEAVRSGIMIAALQGTGCLAAQSRELEEKVNLVDKLLDGHIDALHDVQTRDVSKKLHGYVEQKLSGYLDSGSPVEQMKYKEFERFITSVLDACAVYERMLLRDNSEIINRTLFRMHALVGQLIEAQSENAISKLGKEIVQEYLVYRPVWTKVCPDLLTGLSTLSDASEKFLKKLQEVEKKLQAANLNVPPKVLEKILDNSDDYIGGKEQKLGKDLAVTITYVARQDGGGTYTFQGPTGKVVSKVIFPKFARTMNESHIRKGIKEACS